MAGSAPPPPGRWQFWIDRGGTFTDIVALRPDGAVLTHKLLSSNPARYDDAALAGIRHFLGVAPGAPIPAQRIAAVKMGTTVATNALLERTGEPTALLVTRGFRDALRIGYQNRPRLFDLHIVLPELLYGRVDEVDERMSARGEVVVPLDTAGARSRLRAAWDAGFRAVAIAFLHAYRYPEHERRVAELAREIGFPQVSVSHEVSPLMKLVGRGDTTVVDAYLSPILRRYVDRVAGELRGVRLMFMQSNGGLAGAEVFQGRDSILSGPAGGIVGMVRSARAAGFERVIGFDMGGTSTDVSHFSGELERTFDTLVAGVRMRAPMMSIHTVAAGGGSILHFDGTKYRVGPDSAGAMPGPACYRNDGPLTVTDCNVLLGKIQPAFFPAVFGANGNEPLDASVVHRKFAQLAEEIARAGGGMSTPEQVAEGFIEIAVANMANAIKKISVQRGYDVTRYVLNCFGGAAGQHACRVADALGMTRVLIHPLAGVLSAYGMGLADITAMREKSVELPLAADGIPPCEALLAELGRAAQAQVRAQGVAADRIALLRRAHLRYEGTDAALPVAWGGAAQMRARFEEAYRQRYGFLMPDKALVIEAVSVEVVGAVDGDEAATAVPESAAWNGDGTARSGRCGRELSHVLRRQVAVGAGFPARCADSRHAHRRPGDHCRRQCHHGHRTGMARRHPGPRRDPPRARGGARRAPCGRHPGRSGDAGDLQQPVHVHRRADGRDAGQHRPFGEHQGAAGLLLRPVRQARKPHRQCAPHTGASRLHGREHCDGHPPQRRSNCDRAMSMC